MEINLRAKCSGFLGWRRLLVRNINCDGHSDEEEDYNSENDTDDHDSTWSYDIMRVWVSSSVPSLPFINYTTPCPRKKL